MPVSPTAIYMSGLKELKGSHGGFEYAASCDSMGVKDNVTMGSFQKEESFKEVEVTADFRSPYGHVDRNVLGGTSTGHTGEGVRMWFGGQSQQQRQWDKEVTRTGAINRNFAQRVESNPFQDPGDIEMSTWTLVKGRSHR